MTMAPGGLRQPRPPLLELACHHPPRAPAAPGSGSVPEPRAAPAADPGEELVRAMREQVQDLREEVAFLRAELARRRWPGLKAWRRVSEGEG